VTPVLQSPPHRTRERLKEPAILGFDNDDDFVALLTHLGEPVRDGIDGRSGAGDVASTSRIRSTRNVRHPSRDVLYART